MPIFINILPNIYWCYNDISSPKSRTDFNTDVRKFSEYNRIKNNIELDATLEFWGKSKNYINEIKVQMQKEEYGKLLTLYKKLLDIIKNAYLSNTPTMITTYDSQYTEIGVGVWMYYFNQSASLSFDNVLKMLAYKVIGNVHLSDSLKRFFMLIAANSTK
jgi:hypothetical protein